MILEAAASISRRSPGASSTESAPMFSSKRASFVVPGMSHHRYPVNRCLTGIPSVDAVERAAGLTLFSDEIKARSKHICKTTKCEVIVRRFDDAQKRPEMRRAISSPR